MGEFEKITPKPEDILTQPEANLLQAAGREERPCPTPGCGLPL